MQTNFSPSHQVKQSSKHCKILSVKYCLFFVFVFVHVFLLLFGLNIQSNLKRKVDRQSLEDYFNIISQYSMTRSLSYRIELSGTAKKRTFSDVIIKCSSCSSISCNLCSDLLLTSSGIRDNWNSNSELSLNLYNEINHFSFKCAMHPIQPNRLNQPIVTFWRLPQNIVPRT